MYKMPVNVSLLLDMRAWHKGYRKYRPFWQKLEKGNTSEGIIFFVKTFHRDESFHLNSPWHYRIFCTIGKRYLFLRNFHLWK